MAGHPIFKLNTIIVADEYLQDCILTLTNTIFFHRALGVVQINHSTCPKLKRITFVIQYKIDLLDEMWRLKC